VGPAFYSCLRPWDCVHKSLTTRGVRDRYLLEFKYTIDYKEGCVTNRSSWVGPSSRFGNSDILYLRDTGLEFAIRPVNLVPHKLELVAVFLLQVDNDSTFSYSRTRQQDFDYTNQYVAQGRFCDGSHEGIPVDLIDKMPKCPTEQKGHVCTDLSEVHNFTVVHNTSNTDGRYLVDGNGSSLHDYVKRNSNFTVASHGYLGLPNKRVSKKRQ
jgi:hypothetical protein